MLSFQFMRFMVLWVVCTIGIAIIHLQTISTYCDSVTELDIPSNQVPQEEATCHDNARTYGRCIRAPPGTLFVRRYMFSGSMHCARSLRADALNSLLCVPTSAFVLLFAAAVLVVCGISCAANSRLASHLHAVHLFAAGIHGTGVHLLSQDQQHARQ